MTCLGLNHFPSLQLLQPQSKALSPSAQITVKILTMTLTPGSSLTSTHHLLSLKTKFRRYHSSLKTPATISHPTEGKNATTLPWPPLWSLLLCVFMSSSVMFDSATPRTVARQAPLSMGFPRQEYWSGLPFPPPGDLPDPGVKPGSPALEANSLPSEPPGKPNLFS